MFAIFLVVKFVTSTFCGDKKEYERLAQSNCRSFPPDDTPEPEWQIQKMTTIFGNTGKKDDSTKSRSQPSMAKIIGKYYFLLCLVIVFWEERGK